MKSKNKTTKERLNEVIQEMATALYDIEAIDAVTMREFKTMQIPEVHDLSPEEIKALRLKEEVSQTVFAKFLNASPETIRDWEQGKKHPRGPSLKLLNLISEKGLEILGYQKPKSTHKAKHLVRTRKKIPHKNVA